MRPGRFGVRLRRLRCPRRHALRREPRVDLDDRIGEQRREALQRHVDECTAARRHGRVRAERLEGRGRDHAGAERRAAVVGGCAGQRVDAALREHVRLAEPLAHRLRERVDEELVVELVVAEQREQGRLSFGDARRLVDLEEPEREVVEPRERALRARHGLDPQHRRGREQLAPARDRRRALGRLLERVGPFGQRAGQGPDEGLPQALAGLGEQRESIGIGHEGRVSEPGECGRTATPRSYGIATEAFVMELTASSDPARRRSPPRPLMLRRMPPDPTALPAARAARARAGR